MKIKLGIRIKSYNNTNLPPFALQILSLEIRILFKEELGDL
jgi:hypothetical protein